MAGEPLPSSVRQFILQHLSSVEQLEILLLLMNQTRAHWTAEEIYMVVLSSRTSVVQGLEKFTTAGLVEKSGETPSTYRFLSSSDAPAINELRHCYQEMPVRVIEAIYQRNRDAVQGFADAFKFKREP
jgi:predicted transcriptional regulator